MGEVRRTGTNHVGPSGLVEQYIDLLARRAYFDVVNSFGTRLNALLIERIPQRRL